jgi:FAD/FMN-containing dehydrogenase
MSENATGHDTAALRGRVQGPVFVPGDDGYDAERSGFQLDDPHRPAAIVGATSAADVQAGVAFAAARGLPVATQSTGHGLAARAHGGVLVTTRRLQALHVDPAERTATLEAGVTWGQVIEAAWRHGLAPLNGSSPGVGAVGYVLAGGLGLLGRRYGWAADHVRSLDVVTADAQPRHVTPAEHADLFWALRGGGGGLGIVTRLEVELVPLGSVYGGALFFDAEHAGTVLDAFRSWTETLPDELTSSFALVPFPDLPVLPEPLRGRYVASVRIAFAGGAGAGERLVEPLRSIAPTLMDTVRELPWTESDTIATDPPAPHAYQGIGVLLRDLDAEAARTILDHAGPGAAVPCVVQVNHLGGALARPPASPNAVGHRDARYLLRVLSVVGSGGIAPLVGVHEGLVEALGDRCVGRSPAFQFGEHPAKQARACYEPDAYERLAAIKAAYDPGNVLAGGASEAR